MKYSRQRELIKSVLSKRTNHPTAEDIYQEVHDIEPTISLATVYRNLNLLADNGEIRKIKFQGTSDRFDPITSEHFHFVCNNCAARDELTTIVITFPFISLIYDSLKNESNIIGSSNFFCISSNAFFQRLEVSDIELIIVISSTLALNYFVLCVCCQRQILMIFSFPHYLYTTNIHSRI